MGHEMMCLDVDAEHEDVDETHVEEMVARVIAEVVVLNSLCVMEHERTWI